MADGKKGPNRVGSYKMAKNREKKTITQNYTLYECVHNFGGGGGVRKPAYLMRRGKNVYMWVMVG